MVDFYVVDKFVDSIKTMLDKTLKDLGAMRGSLMVVDLREKVLKIKVATSINSIESIGRDIIENSRPGIGEGVAGIVAETQKPLLINDIEELKKTYPSLITSTDSARYESSLVVPIVEHGITIAVLNINDKLDGKKFTTEDLRLAVMLAEYCGVALKLERQNQGILHVNEIIREISLTNSLPEIYRLVVSKGAEILRCEMASLMLVEKEQEGVHNLVVKESTDKTIIGESRRLGESVSGYVWKTGEPILIKSVEDGIRDRRFKILNKPGSFIVVPLNLKYQSPYALNVALKSINTIGVLNFTARLDGTAFTDDQLEAIVNYSNLVAIAIEKARYYNDSKAAYLSTVKSLSAALESKDSYTKGHSDNVEYLCGRLAAKLDLTEKQKEDLQIAAVLHDIGKIAIPENILNKKGKLTAEEYEKIQTHISEAENILRHTFYLDNSREIISCHHERFDGMGYPAGLEGAQIPLGARVLAVADAFHAMTSNRPYRKAMELSKVKEEIRRCSGKQFDPEMAALLLELLESEHLNQPEAEGRVV